MGDVVSAIFGQGETSEEKRAKRFQLAKEQQVRKKEEREGRRLASTVKTQTATQRGGSLFPSDFAPSSSEQLG